MVNLLNSCGQIPLESEVVIAVPSIHLLSTKDMIRNDIAIASEVRYRVFAPETLVHSINISVLKTFHSLYRKDVAFNAGYGAYTGETSAALLVDAGVKWTLTGHSERRVGFGGPGESSAVVGKKTQLAIAAG